MGHRTAKVEKKDKGRKVDRGQAVLGELGEAHLLPHLTPFSSRQLSKEVILTLYALVLIHYFSATVGLFQVQ